jgi:hypothetical protein
MIAAMREAHPELSIRTALPSETVDAAQLVWELRPRFETTILDGRIESRAGLRSDEHLALLARIFGTPAP